jgi:ABC-type branched-subunit amino acid transport system substrate-binding protein
MVWRTMPARPYATILTASVVTGILTIAASVAETRHDPGASDAEIRVGQTMPYSGPASAYSVVGQVEAAYFRMINERGGVNGRKITLLSYDDGANPAKTVEQVRRLVESDEVLLTFQNSGTAQNGAIQKYLNDKGVPHLFVSARATRFEDPQNFPWTIGFAPSTRTEARVYARFILDNYPSAKIGVLYQNDDSGKDWLGGLKEGLGNRAAAMIVGAAAYEATDPTVDSQIVALKASGSDLLFDGAAAKFATQAIRKVAELSWRPVHILGVSAASGRCSPPGVWTTRRASSRRALSRR